MTHITEFGSGIPADSQAVDLRKLPHRDWQDKVSGITSIVIVPATKRSGLHDSGFRCMDFAACHYGTAYCLLSGCSDVIHLGGIGGYNNRNWARSPESLQIRRGDWSIDCLPNSGLLQIFSGGGLDVGVGLSSFDIYSTETCPDRAEAKQ